MSNNRCERCGKETTAELNFIRLRVHNLQDGSIQIKEHRVCDDCFGEAEKVFDHCCSQYHKKQFSNDVLEKIK